MSVISQFPLPVQAIFSEYILNEWVVAECRSEAIERTCRAFLQQNGRATDGVRLPIATVQCIQALRGRAVEINLGMEYACVYALAEQIRQVEAAAIQRLLLCCDEKARTALRAPSQGLALTQVQILKTF